MGIETMVGGIDRENNINFLEKKWSNNALIELIDQKQLKINNANRDTFQPGMKKAT